MKQIEDAYKKQSITLSENSYEWQAARNAFTIVADRVGRATYDAFVKDYQALKKKGIDPNNPQTKSAKYWLNNLGELSKLEITKEENDRIFNEGFAILDEATVDVESKRTQEGEPSPLFKQLSSSRKDLQDSLAKAQQAVQASQPVEGPPE